MNEKYLITGGSVKLGIHLKELLSCETPTHQQFDITDPKKIRNYLNEDYKAVIHLAAISDQQYAANHQEESYIVNVLGCRNLAKITNEKNLKIIYISTDYVFPGTKGNYSETALPNPANWYGYTKLAIENNLKWFSDLKGIHYASLRYFNAAGYDLRNRINGLENNPQNLIPIVMETAIGERHKVNIFGNDYNTKDGTGIRDYVHVSDLAKAHIYAIEYIYKKKKNITLNLGSSIGYSVLEILNKAILITKKNIDYTYVERRLGDSDVVIAIAELSKEVLGWEAKYSDLDSIINSTWEAYKSRL